MYNLVVSFKIVDFYIQNDDISIYFSLKLQKIL